jgi:hypothetical protein
VRYWYGAAVISILSLEAAGLGWLTLIPIIGLVVLISVRGVVERRRHEIWMDDLARATYRLMRPVSVRQTSSWTDDR